jgi:hypothetical protein
VACGNARAPRGGALAGGSVVARRQQGVVGDLEGDTGEVLGKEERAGAHRNGVPMVRRRKRRRAMVFNGGGVAPVVVDEGGWVLQFEGDPGVKMRRSIEGRSSSEGRSPEGRWTAVTIGRSPARRKGSGGGKPVRWTPGRWGRACGARAWTDEMNGTRGRNFSADGRQLGFKGSGGEGVEGWAPLGGRAGERGAGVAWSSAAAWRRRGSGPAATRVGGALPHNSGERRGRRDAGRRG